MKVSELTKLLKKNSCYLYVYPAVFEHEESGLYSIFFPNVEGCYTSGKNIIDGYKMAEDVLCLCLYDMEKDGIAPPAPSSPDSIPAPESGFVSLISCDTNYYKRHFSKKAVKKTVTIPAQLNFAAEQSGLNFSRILQDGIKRELNIQ